MIAAVWTEGVGKRLLKCVFSVWVSRYRAKLCNLVVIARTYQFYYLALHSVLGCIWDDDSELREARPSKRLQHI